MISVLKLVVYVLLIQLNDAIYSIPDKVSTQIGASYTLMLLDDKIEPKECYVTDINGNSTYSIDLNTPGLPLVVTNTRNYRKTIMPKAKETNIMTSLGYGICGFKLDNVGENYVSPWNMSFIDKNGDNYYKEVTVNRNAAKPRVETQYAPVGSSFYISCAASLDGIKLSLNFCQLYNPRGELVKMDRESCFYSKQLSTIADYGRWRCVLSYESNMVETKVYYDVFEKEVNIIKTWHNETDTHVNIGCSLTNSSTGSVGDSNFCLMVRPDGKQFSLRAGLANLRYTSIHMNITKGICAMEIKKPLDEIEKGLWRCEHHHTAGYNPNTLGFSPIGGFINLSEDSRSLPPAEIPKQIFTHINESFTVSCRVPFTSPSCYMRGPDGVMYPVEDNRGPTLGLCKFTKEQATLADNGTWFCGFAKKTGEPDAVYSFEVYLPESLAIKPELETLESRSASTVTLKCSTRGLGDYPIQYCRFLSPDGQMYFINPSKSSNRMSYEGRGFKYGDCGIKIKDVRKEDEGIWSCITRIGYNFEKPEVYSNIHLAVNDNLSVASMLGIFMGVGVVLVGVLIIVIHKLRRNRASFNTGFSARFFNSFRRNATARSSNSSNSSNNSAAVFNINDSNNNERNYQATNNNDRTEENVIRSRMNVFNETSN